MPLLKGRLYPLVKSLSDVKADETIHTIPHSKEQFRCKDEYDKRLALYKEPLWTCQCTGHINLTHEEAFKSEKRIFKLLKSDFESVYEKTVLELIHHSNEPLDQLTGKAWKKVHEELVIGEHVVLKIKKDNKDIRGKIVKVNRGPKEEGASTSNCSSPSSNKENQEDNKSPTNNKSPTLASPKKYTPLKLLPYSYSIKLDGADKVINGVPVDDIRRQLKVPSKDLIKQFIRAYAVRGNYNTNSPWAVHEDLVKKYSLTNKYADFFFMSPSKMAEIGKKALEEANKNKRKSSFGEGSPKKKRKMDLKLSKNSQKTSKSASKKVAKGKVTTPKDSPRKVMSPKKGTPKKVAKDTSGSDDSSSDEDIVLAELRKSPEKMSPAKVKRSPKKSVSPKKSTKVKPPIGPDGQPLKRKRGRPRKEESEKMKAALSTQKRAKGTPAKKNKKDEVTPKSSKKMKQMTLFDLKSKKSGPKTPQKSPKKVASPKKSPAKSPFKMPPLVTRLQKLMVKEEKGANFYQLVARCARELTLKQIKGCPEDVRQVMMKKYEALQEKKKILKMSPAEKEEYLKKKKDEMKKRLRAYMIKRWHESKRRVEDTHLELSPLPTPKMLSTPDGLANEQFGDIVMVTEFINCYKQLLTPENDTSIATVTTDSLMNALVAGEAGAAVTSRVLAILLQTLLQDDIASDYKELFMPLSDIPLNKYTTSELIRLCLRRKDLEDDSSTNHSDEGDEGMDDSMDVPEAILERLETSEFHELSVDEQLHVFRTLCYRIMGSYSIQDYLNEKQQGAADLWKQRIAGQKEKNDRMKEEKEKKKKKKSTQQQSSPDKEKDEKEEKEDGLTITSFYGKKEEEENAEDEGDLVSIVKRRRAMSAKAAAEKAIREKEQKIKREKEYEEERKTREKEAFEKDFHEGILQAKLALRQTPIGTDRNHDRYWIFHYTTPGLYVEKGWAPGVIGYCTQDKKKKLQDDDLESVDTGVESDCSGLESDTNEDEGPSKAKRGRKSQNPWKFSEKTIPHTGQNLWFVYDQVEDIDQVIKNLSPMGARESGLKTELQKRYSELVTALKKGQKTIAEEVAEKFNSVEGFREELLDMETRLRNGGLGGVPDFKTWEPTLSKATKVSEFGKCLIETHQHILEKFLQGVLLKQVKKPKVKVKVEDETGSKAVEDKDEDGEDAEPKEEEVESLGDEYLDVGKMKWTKAVEECQTFSRFHVLLGVLDSSIKWEKSAENAKCKICRKKGDDDELLLCDDCNQAFHLFCLRPALMEVPTGEWFCAACTPLSKRRATIGRNYRKMAGESSEEDSDDDDDDDEEEEEEEEIENEAACAMCGGDEGLIGCATCVLSFHLDCHDPPLRREPRSNWRCTQCVTGIQIRKSRRSAGKKRKRYEEDSDFDDYDERPAKKRARSSRDQGSHRGGRPPRQYDDYITESAPGGSSSRAAHRDRNSSGRNPRSSDVGTRRSSGDRGDAQSVSPSSATYSTRRSGEKFLMNGDLGKERLDGHRKLIMDVIKRIRKCKSSWPFWEPVNTQQVPDYYDIVKHPMDLQTMEDKCVSEQYDEPQELVDDIALMLSNGELYNKRDSLVGKCIVTLERHIVDLLSRYLPETEYPREQGNCPTQALTNGGSASTVVFDDHAYFTVK